MKVIKVILSPQAEEVYEQLNKKASKSKTDKSILNAINKKIEFIKANLHYGNPISKNVYLKNILKSMVSKIYLE